MDEARPALVSYGRRIGMLAAAHPEQVAIVFAPHEGAECRISWRDLDRASTQLARLLLEYGVNERSLLVVGLPNCPEHYVATYAGWKLGALVLPMRANLPDRERDGLLDVGKPAMVIADWEGIAYPLLQRHDLQRAKALSVAPLPDRIPHPGKSIGSGGSTGRSKIIVDPHPWAAVPDDVGGLARIGFRPRQVQLIAGPLYHNSPFSWGHYGLFHDHQLVLMERFDAARAVDLIERHQVSFGFLAPTMLRRIIQLPGIEQRDFSSVQSFFHTAAPCPPWLKRAWIDLIGGERIYEGFGATEAVGSCGMRGDEWLRHPGSVGRPQGCDLRILDEQGHDLPAGAVGEIFMRPHDPGPSYYYIGAPPAKTTDDGFTSVGDLGWVDAEGYLFLADRRTDLIITGGANVYPAEVEAALTEHPGVGDVAVIGVPDEEWGKRVHALIQSRDGQPAPTVTDLDAHCRARIASYKVPKSYEFVTGLPRDDTGKIRRSGLAAERESGWIEGMVWAKA